MFKRFCPLLLLDLSCDFTILNMLIDRSHSHLVKECSHGYTAGMGGNCLTEKHIDNLWRLHFEVTLMHVDAHLFVFTNKFHLKKHTEIHALIQIVLN